MIVSCMLKEVRGHAGLGNPPTAYYNNIPESANAMIKCRVRFKESEMTTFCKEMSTLCHDRRRISSQPYLTTGLIVWHQSFLPTKCHRLCGSR